MCSDDVVTMTTPLLNYMLSLPVFDLESLHCLRQLVDRGELEVRGKWLHSAAVTSLSPCHQLLRYPLLQLMELACMGSLPNKSQQGGAGEGVASPMLDWCASVLLPTPVEDDSHSSKPITPATVSIGNHPQKIKELSMMLQFLILYGLSPSSSLRAVM